jgi:peptide/nickel transport system ATP-binding protein
VVRHIAHRTAVMYLGRIVEAAPTGDLFAAPRHPYAEALLAASPEPDPEARRQRIELPGEVPSLLRRPSGCEFHPRCPRAQPRCRGEAPGFTDDRERGWSCHFPLPSSEAAA